MAKILFIVSGATYWVLKDGTRYATGYWAEEFANPYKIVTDAGHEVVVATPNGVTPNVDMMSLRPEMAGGAQGALELEAIIRSAEVMRRPLKLSDVRLEDYDAVYLPGGHGPMADLAFDADVGRLLTAQLASGNPSVHRVPRSRLDAGHQNPRRVALQGLPGHGLHQRGGGGRRARSQGDVAAGDRSQGKGRRQLQPRRDSGSRTWSRTETWSPGRTPPRPRFWRSGCWRSSTSAPRRRNQRGRLGNGWTGIEKPYTSSFEPHHWCSAGRCGALRGVQLNVKASASVGSRPYETDETLASVVA